MFLPKARGTLDCGDRFRVLERAFGIDDPRLVKELVKERLRLLGKIFTQPCYKPGPEDCAHGLHGEQEFAFIAGRLPFTQFGYPSSGDDTM